MDTKRIWIAFACGVGGTIVMSVPMIAASVAGISPMPKPIPAAIVIAIFGKGVPKPALMVLAAGSHLLYGGIWAAVLAAISRRVDLWKGLALGIFLWAMMQLVVLPSIGWGFFGARITPKIALATLILHLIYGATTGYLLQRFVGEPARSLVHFSC